MGCVSYVYHISLSLSINLKQFTSCYIESNFFGFCWARWVIFSLVIMLTHLISRCRLRHACADEIQLFSIRSVLIASCFYDVWKPYTAFIFINTFLGFCFVHGIDLKKKGYNVGCNFLVIVFQNHFNFRVIIWSWQHLRVHTSLCLCEIIEDWTPCGLSPLLTVAFRLNIRVKVTSTVLENIRRSSWTIHRGS